MYSEGLTRNQNETNATFSHRKVTKNLKHLEHSIGSGFLSSFLVITVKPGLSICVVVVAVYLHWMFPLLFRHFNCTVR